MTSLPNFGDVGQGSSRVVTGDVIRDCLKVVLGLSGKNTSLKIKGQPRSGETGMIFMPPQKGQVRAAHHR